MRNTEEKEWIRKIQQIGEKKTPFMLTDLDAVVGKVREFNELLPTVDIYYAIKSNNDPKIIKELQTMVKGYDIASIGEFRQLKDLGISARSIMYSNPVKIPSHIEEAYKNGVTHFALDSMDEVEKLAKYAPNSTVYVRVKVSDYGSKFPLSGKFGLDPKDVSEIAKAASDAGLLVKGLTFHVGSQSENHKVWDAALSICGKLISELKVEGIEIEFINMGGGYPAVYEDVAPTIKDAAKVINQAIRTYIPEGIKICAEPGRYISANSSLIVTTVIGMETRGDRDWLYLDMGVFQGLIEVLEINMHYPVFTTNHKRGAKKSFVLTGPSCDAHDTIGLDYELPADIKVGDQLFIGATGAYTLVYASSFNGFDPPIRHHIQARAN